MTVTTGLSGNEIYCLAQKKLTPGNIVIGNSVRALGLLAGMSSGLSAMMGGELKQITSLINEGRVTAFQRMLDEAIKQQATGITGVTSELIFNAGNIEFLSMGSIVYGEAKTQETFSTVADGQELYAQLDVGYKPISFAFGNVAYSLGVGRGLLGGLKTFRRGEIKEYSDMFNQTRNIALQRLIQHAVLQKANAVLGIQTTILPLSEMNEMLMLGTASSHRSLPADSVVTSDMRNIEMWNMAKIGYSPLRLLLGTSVYSLGFVGNVSSLMKSFVRGEINALTRMIYDARENALGIMNDEAKAIGADDVVGVKTYVYQLGNGLVEFLAIGTAVKKNAAIAPESDQLPPQAVVVDRNTFFDGGASVSRATNTIGNMGNIFSYIIVIVFVVAFVLLKSCAK